MEYPVFYVANLNRNGKWWTSLPCSLSYRKCIQSFIFEFSSFCVLLTVFIRNGVELSLTCFLHLLRWSYRLFSSPFCLYVYYVDELFEYWTSFAFLRLNLTWAGSIAFNFPVFWWGFLNFPSWKRLLLFSSLWFWCQCDACFIKWIGECYPFFCYLEN